MWTPSFFDFIFFCKYGKQQTSKMALYRSHIWFATVFRMIIVIGASSENSQLSYSQGGEYEVDAGARAGVVAWYVDADGGNDDNDGRAPDSAWKSAPKALNNAYAPSSVLLFKRGTRLVTRPTR